MRHLGIMLFAAVGACQGGGEPRERCLSLPVNDSPVVARIGDTALTMSDVERRLREQGSAAQRYTRDANGLRRFVEDQVRLELLAQAALERGLDRDPDVIDTARKVMVRKLLLQDLGPQAWGDQANDAAVRAYYESHLDDYVQPERRRVSHVQLAPTPEGRALAQSTIDKLAREPDEAGRALGRVAAQLSLDRDSRARAGELSGYLSHGELARDFGQTFADEAFELGAGELSPAPVQSTRGWHVVYVIARREPYTRSLDEAADDIRGRLLTSGRSQLFDKYLRDLRQRYPVVLHEERLPDLTSRLVTSQGNPAR